jgi:nucleoside-diphosphate-sugar epimerase
MALEAIELCSMIGCTTFVGAGSQAEFGLKMSGPIGKNSTEDPVTAYGICKFAAGKLVMTRSAELGIRCIWTRIFSVFGPHDRSSSLISYTIQSLKEGKNLFLTKGTQIWDYLYSADAAKALYLIGEKGIDGKKYCIGSGKGRPLHEYIDFIKSQINPAAEIKYGATPFKKNSIMYLVADIQDLSEDTGFFLEYTFEDGIRKLLNDNC